MTETNMLVLYNSDIDIIDKLNIIFEYDIIRKYDALLNDYNSDQILDTYIISKVKNNINSNNMIKKLIIQDIFNYCVDKNNISIIKFILSRKYDIDDRCLKYIIQFGSKDMIDLLIKYGIPINDYIIQDMIDKNAINIVDIVNKKKISKIKYEVYNTHKVTHVFNLLRKKILIIYI